MNCAPFRKLFISLLHYYNIIPWTSSFLNGAQFISLLHYYNIIPWTSSFLNGAQFISLLHYWNKCNKLMNCAPFRKLEVQGIIL
jgi:hypothetical protein